MARYQEKIKEAYLLIIGERKRAPVKTDAPYWNYLNLLYLL